jgi:plasmid stability protein
MDYSRYRLTLKGKRGLRLRPLAFRPKPDAIPGESLKGLVARAAVRNGFRSLTKVVRLADIETTLGLPNTQVGAAGRLAFFLKVPEEEVRSRMYSSIERRDANSDFVDFFGVTLRSLYLERWRRRVSPRALACSPHHRAIHDLRVFSFCPETLETLIDTCPVCCKPLRWFITRGVQFCEYCVDEDDNPTVDLRDFFQPLIEVDDPSGLQLITDLVNPDAAMRAKALGSCNPAVRALGPGKLFELALTLVRALKTPCSGYSTQLSGLKTIKDLDIFDPTSLSQMGRALMSWREGFDAAAARLRSSALERVGYSGLFKELGALHAAAIHRHVPDEVREILRSAIKGNMERTAHQAVAPRSRMWRHRPDLVDVMMVASILRTKAVLVAKLARSGLVTVQRTTAKRHTVLYLKAEIEAIAAVRFDLIEGRKAARQVGLPFVALEALADARVISRAEGPAVLLAGRRIHYRRSSVERFLDCIRKLARHGVVPKGSRALDATLRRLPAGERPWLAIVQAIENGTLPVVEEDGTGRDHCSLACLSTGAGSKQWWTASASCLLSTLMIKHYPTRMRPYCSGRPRGRSAR